GGESSSKAWKDIWGCGQGIGAIKVIGSAGDLVSGLSNQYNNALKRVLSA
ncbi:MAG: nitronate monooxygenase, partial [Porticoccaceae bacterium]|nr:nitronate monooxygenase [Porticoccaceae bacterium]